MCGYFGNTVSGSSLAPLDVLKAHPELAGSFRDNPGAGPASTIDIITNRGGELAVRCATWWLLLEPAQGGGFLPSKYTSFNTKSTKLNIPKSAGYHPYRSSRCIVPATYVIEGEGPKGARRYHKISPANQQFALGGLYREWVDSSTGEVTLSCSVITLPPHPAWEGVHSKSTPLFLPPDLEAQYRWLSPDIQDTSEFSSWLTPGFPDDLVCTPIDRPGLQTEIGPKFTISRMG